MPNEIKIKNVKIEDGIYLDFDNGKVVLLQYGPAEIMLVGLDDTYRGSFATIEDALMRNDDYKFAKTFSGQTITL